MRDLHFTLRCFLAMFSLAVLTSCARQNNPHLQQDVDIEKHTLGTQYEKLFKSQPTKNGEAENVRCGLLDQYGHLWFGTTGHGVFKYDGTSFTLFTKEDGLGGNRVVALGQDSAGNVLLGTDRGLYFYDGTLIAEYVNDERIRNSSISALYLDSRNALWVGTLHAGLFLFDGNTVTNLLSGDRVVNDFNLTLNGICDIKEDSTIRGPINRVQMPIGILQLRTG